MSFGSVIIQCNDLCNENLLLEGPCLWFLQYQITIYFTFFNIAL